MVSDRRRQRRDEIGLADEQVSFLRHLYKEGDTKGEWPGWFRKNKKALSRILSKTDLFGLEARLSETIAELLQRYDVTPRDFSEFDVTALPEVRSMLARHLTCVLLCPSAEKSSGSRSHMGGQPQRLTRWPLCPTCSVPMNFVLQLFKDEFPTMYFPEDREVFFLFRCPDPHCCDDWRRYDRTMLWIHSRHETGAPSASRPATLDIVQDAERQLSEYYYFQPVERADYPSFAEGCEEWWGESFVDFAERWSGSPVYDKFYDVVINQTGTKIGGFPSWQQIPHFPLCACGRKKVFFFQLASFYREYKVRMPFREGEEIGIGDNGNIYFFYCPACGEESIETTWDCG